MLKQPIAYQLHGLLAMSIIDHICVGGYLPETILLAKSKRLPNRSKEEWFLVIFDPEYVNFALNFRSTVFRQQNPFVYRLYPSKSQERRFNETLDVCRDWYNRCLAERQDAYKNEGRSIHKYAQMLNIKYFRQADPQAATVPYRVLQVVTSDLDMAFKAFFRRVKAGKKPGYPRFKGCNHFNSFGYSHYNNGFKIDGRRLKLTFIGRVPVRWDRPLEGEIKTLRIKRVAGKWYACFVCKVEDKLLPSTGRDVGIDVGISNLIATSDGQTVSNPKWYRTEQKKLRVAQRRVARRKKDGANRRKAVLMLQRQHGRIANRRKDFLNKLAFNLIQEYDRIAIENIKVNSLSHNRHLSKSILDSGWYHFRRRLEQKAIETGRLVVAVNPAYTSRICSNCGASLENLTLKKRQVSCACGLSLDRDVNAALNILRAGQARWGLT
jgi:putative transposase